MYYYLFASLIISMNFIYRFLQLAQVLDIWLKNLATIFSKYYSFIIYKPQSYTFLTWKRWGKFSSLCPSFKCFHVGYLFAVNTNGKAEGEPCFLYIVHFPIFLSFREKLFL